MANTGLSYHEEKDLEHMNLEDEYTNHSDMVHIEVVKDLTAELAAAKDRIAELRSALLNLMAGVKGLPPLTAIAGVLEAQYKDAEKAIESSNNL